MIVTRFNSNQFLKEIGNVLEYSIGFADGAKLAKTNLLNGIGGKTVELLKSFIDSNARTNPAMLHHIYEWNKVGNPGARLFEITYLVNTRNVSFQTSFTQSQSIKRGSSEPFYNKAQIMESGKTVVVTPKNGEVLRFEENGEQVFTKSPVVITNPGGDNVAGAYQDVLNSFFNNYFSQSFLQSSGIAKYIKNPLSYKKNIRSGARGGRSVGVSTGFQWMSKAGDM
jgi:hypothetical protein